MVAGREVATASETADNEALAAELKAELPLASDRLASIEVFVYPPIVLAK